jgi:hypothetical protein
MSKAMVLENIEEMRRRQGIVDAELGADIGRLRPGDCVRISFEISNHAYETLTVQLTSLRGDVLRGRLVKSPKSPSLKAFMAGSLIKFGPEHIHSIVGRQNSAMSVDTASPSPTRDSLLRAALREAERECGHGRADLR